MLFARVEAGSPSDPAEIMSAAESLLPGRRPRRVLFIQGTEPAIYPPLIHASMLMAEAGWDVIFLSAPFDGCLLELSHHPRIAQQAIPARPSHVMGKAAYARYAAAAARLALRLQPDVVYASDPLGAGPGLLAARLARSRLVYHEHDSPAPGSLRASRRSPCCSCCRVWRSCRPGTRRPSPPSARSAGT